MKCTDVGQAGAGPVGVRKPHEVMPNPSFPARGARLTLRRLDPLRQDSDMHLDRRRFGATSAALLAAGAGWLPGAAGAQGVQTLLNVSYDPTRELYAEFNAAFARHWKATTGRDVALRQSHGGSGKQARAVIDGIDADVVTLALAGDVDALHRHGQLIPRDWQKRLPNNSSPYTSTIVLVVRQGNPKGIRDWEDLVRPGVSVITPNPKTSGGARWNYLAAWEYARRRHGGEAGAREFVERLYRQVPVLDTGARGASVTFAQRNQGDVFISWENEAHLLEKEFGHKVDIVYPTLSVLAEPPVTVVDRNVDRKGTRELAEAYLRHLYSDEGQDIAGRHFYRPTSPRIAAKHAQRFPKIELFGIDQAFGGWAAADKAHFADGATFDRIWTKG